MKNCVKLSSWWFLLLLLTLFACTPGDIIETTRPSNVNPSSTPTPTSSIPPTTIPTSSMESSATPTVAVIANADILFTFTPTASPGPTLTATPLPSATPEPPFTPTPTAIPPTRQIIEPPCPEQQPQPAQNLKIYFSQNGELQRWENGTTTSLTSMNGRILRLLDNGNLILFTRDYELWVINNDGSQERFLIDGVNENYLSVSDDNTIIAFGRNNELWAINIDGSQERLLVSEADFAAMTPTDPGVGLQELHWIPCTHQLIFNTHIRYEVGVGYADDLYLVDADTLFLKNLFPPGKGGRVHFSPKNQQMALVTPGTITLANYDSSSPQVVLTYPQISTGSSSPFYPSLIWSPDSQLLYVAIPPSDPMQDSPYEPTTLWSLPVYGGETVKLTEFPASWGISSIAPNLSLITYPTIVNDGEVFSQTLHIIQPNGTEIATFPNRGLVSWLPDSTRFIFYSDGNFYVGTLSGESIQISGVEREILGLFWLDNDRFLLYHRDEAGQEKLSLGTIGGELAHIIQGKMEAYPIIIK